MSICKVCDVCGGVGNRMYVDPPSGWRYGFPKVLKLGASYDELLKASGYPEKDLDFAKKYSRGWDEKCEKCDGQGTFTDA